MTEPLSLRADWGGTSIPFTLRRSARRTIRISVAPDGSVSVLAPEHATDEQILTRVARRGGWIVRRFREFERWRPRTPPRRYVPGETHLFLGRQHRLRLECSSLENVLIRGDRIIICLPEPNDPERCRALLESWYAARCREVFPERVAVVAPPFLRLGVGYPSLVVRRMTRRWGSLTAAGNLVLNRDLIRASPRLVDYVVAHELAHGAHPNHGPEWQALLTRVMPDWQERKALLELQLI
jgi:predicted metal-dependent hydrolase